MSSVHWVQRGHVFARTLNSYQLTIQERPDGWIWGVFRKGKMIDTGETATRKAAEHAAESVAGVRVRNALVKTGSRKMSKDNALALVRHGKRPLSLLTSGGPSTPDVIETTGVEVSVPRLGGKVSTKKTRKRVVKKTAKKVAKKTAKKVAKKTSKKRTSKKSAARTQAALFAGMKEAQRAGRPRKAAKKTAKKTTRKSSAKREPTISADDIIKGAGKKLKGTDVTSTTVTKGRGRRAKPQVVWACAGPSYTGCGGGRKGGQGSRMVGHITDPRSIRRYTGK